MMKFKPTYHPANAIQISLDLETASTASNAAIVQLAAVADTGAEFNEYISLASCEAHGMDVDLATMRWWNEQDPELRKRVFGGTIKVQYVLEKFLSWCLELCEGEWDRIYLWGNGADFDCTILKNAVEIFGSYPFNFRNHEHLRTLLRMVPTDFQREVFDGYMQEHGATHQLHDALCDARYQGWMINECLNYLTSSRDVFKDL